MNEQSYPARKGSWLYYPEYHPAVPLEVCVMRLNFWLICQCLGETPGEKIQCSSQISTIMQDQVKATVKLLQVCLNKDIV